MAGDIRGLVGLPNAGLRQYESGEPLVGQPVMVRMQGVPTMPGYRDRPGKWNIQGLQLRRRLGTLFARKARRWLAMFAAS